MMPGKTGRAAYGYYGWGRLRAKNLLRPESLAGRPAKNAEPSGFIQP
jgi:hypothetical protein